jgi:hypothetical protein
VLEGGREEGGYGGEALGGVLRTGWRRGWLVDWRRQTKKLPIAFGSVVSLTMRGGWRGLLLLLLLSFLFYTLFGLVGSGLGGRMDDG